MAMIGREGAAWRWVAAACLALALVPAWAQPATAHATRQGQAIQQLEDALLAAMQGRNRAQLERLLAEGFEMIVAQEPGNPIDREAWLDSVAKGAAGSWEIQQIGVRDLGNVAVASFLLHPAAAGKPSIFMVDTWQREGSQWSLLLRHAAPALGSRRDIPGDALVARTPKKY